MRRALRFLTATARKSRSRPYGPYGLRRIWTSLTTVLFVYASVGYSQVPVLLYQKNGAPYDQLGWLVAGAGDVNGDGKADFIIGVPAATPGGLTNAGSAYVYSGATGALLYQKNGAGANDRFGESVAGVGDVDGDGKVDFMIGAPHAYGASPNVGSAFVYSGASGLLLYQKNGTGYNDQLGSHVVGAGDVNGDGRADFIVAARLADVGGFGDAGSVYVYSGADGSLLYQKNGPSSQAWLGSSVASTGDVNEDGKPDFIIGAPGVSPGGLSFAGSAYVNSGADGALLFQIDGATAGSLLGLEVAGVGDVNDDGKADFGVGTFAPGFSDSGSVYVYSGVDGSLLYQKKHPTLGNGYWGISVAGVGDVNDDRKADFIIGVAGSSSAFVYSGADGALLFQIDGAAPHDYFGYSVAGAGDVNGDGRADFIIGAPAPSFIYEPHIGSAYVYAFSCAPRGDVAGAPITNCPDGTIDIVDIVAVINNVVFGTPFCGPEGAADVGGDPQGCPDTIVDIVDIVSIINNVVFGTPFCQACL